MKTLQSILNNPERRLSVEEMKVLRGGSSIYYCIFGFTDNPVSPCQTVTSSSLENALNFMSDACAGAGATCYGSGHGCPSEPQEP